MAAPTPQNRNPAISQTEEERLESLKREVDRLHNDPRLWQQRYMFLAGLTTLVGGLMLLAQYKQFRASVDLEEAQSALVSQQDRQRVSHEEKFTADLKGKDERIATLDLERVKLRDRMLRLGPREYVIASAAETFTNNLSSFSGQKFRFEACKSDLDLPMGGIVNESEIGTTVAALQDALTKAGWKLDTSTFPLQLLDGCGHIGIDAIIPSGSSANTRHAAESLNRLLEEAELAIPVKVSLRRPNDGGAELPLVIRIGRKLAHPRSLPARTVRNGPARIRFE